MDKKVLISCTYYVPNISGVSIYAQILAEKMAEKGTDVSVLTSRFSHKLAKLKLNKRVKIQRSAVWKKVGKGVIMPFFVRDAQLAVRENEIVNCHLPQIESFMIAIWAKIYKKKLIVTHHCEFNFKGPWHNKLIALITYPFHLVTYLLADKIVSYTQDYAKTSIFLKHFKKKLNFILPPVVVGEWNKQESKKIKKKLEIRKDEKVVSYVGRIGWEKGLDGLIESIKVLKKKRKIKLLLIGPYTGVAGDNSYFKLKKKIEKNSEWIKLVGSVEHDKLVNYYKISDCLVLPSTNNLETFGIVQAEAMVSGCPVVASNLPGVRMPVRLTGMGKIAKIGDIKDLAKKIRIVLDGNFKEKNKIKKAKKIFSLERFVKSYEKVFE
ncbi:hypothetical protein DRH14_03520 [Candidatus Shapirobacteria bacterium]|nr:MAG: hypothetical protein DRH14_03520 [Candidatus Shapirobacteria bacterium]